MFYVYFLKSKKNGKYYVGSTHCLEIRLKGHNAGKVRSTKGLVPHEFVYAEKCLTKHAARMREFEIKKRKSRRYIETLIHGKQQETTFQ